MHNFFHRIRKLKANSFTLVELLVVISIIGLLAGLAVPAIQGGMERAKAQADVSNIRQLGILFTQEADDNYGIYRRAEVLTNTNTAASTLDVYKGAIKDRSVPAVKVFAGSTPAGIRPASTADDLAAINCAYAYGNGLDRLDEPDLPLFITKGNGATFGTEDVSMNKSQSPWRDRGITVYRLGGDASFIRPNAKDGLVLKKSLTTNKPIWTGATIQDP